MKKWLNKPSYLNTLGVAYYRTGRFEQAVEMLNKAVRTNEKGGNAWDFLFLTMAYHQLGQTALAQSEYEKALAWAKLRSPKQGLAGELEMVRKEADGLLNKP